MRLGRPDGRAFAFENTASSRISPWRLLIRQFLDGAYFFGSLYEKVLIKAEEDWPEWLVHLAI